MAIKNANHGFGRRDQQIRRRELFDQLRGERCGAQAAADIALKTPDVFAVDLADLGDASEVMDRHPGMVGRTAFEGEFKFARQILTDRIAQEIFRDGMRVRPDVKDFLLGHTGIRAGRHIAHGVAAGFARGQAVFGELLEHPGNIAALDMVHLNGLAGGDMRALRGGVGFRDISQGVELVRIEIAPFHLDPDHVFVSSPADAVGAVFQAEFFEIIRVHGAGFELSDVFFKGSNFRGLSGRDRVCLRGCCRSHGLIIPNRGRQAGLSAGGRVRRRAISPTGPGGRFPRSNAARCGRHAFPGSSGCA